MAIGSSNSYSYNNQSCDTSSIQFLKSSSLVEYLIDGSIKRDTESADTSRVRVSRTPNITLPAAAAKPSRLDLAPGVRVNAVKKVVVGDDGFERF